MATAPEVLLIEDSAALATVYEAYLCQAGYSVRQR